MIDRTKLEALYWNKGYTVEEIASKLSISFWTVYNIMKKYNINLRDRSEAGYNYNKIKPQFEMKTDLSVAEDKLRIAGIMIYWAEGTFKGNTVDFANSNPEMVKIFLRFLREICGISEERLRVYLYAYSSHDIEALKMYWRNITKISLKQFTKPYIRKTNPNLSNRQLPYGLVHIRYNDKRLLALLKHWIDEYIKWAGTQAAKGDRLCKSSVLLKSRMEK